MHDLCVCLLRRGMGGSMTAKIEKQKRWGVVKKMRPKVVAALVDRNSFYFQFSSSDVTSPMSPNGAVHV